MSSFTIIHTGIALGTSSLAYASYSKFGVGSATYSKYEPALAATTIWALLYYVFLFNQSIAGFIQLANLTTKAKKDGEKPPSLSSIKYGKSGGLPVLRASRAAGNMLEQSIPFLVSLWLHAILVNTSDAANLGLLWLVIRSFYPLVFGKGALLFLVTVPNYAIIAMLLSPLVHNILTIS